MSGIRRRIHRVGLPEGVLPAETGAGDWPTRGHATGYGGAAVVKALSKAGVEHLCSTFPPPAHLQG